MKLPNNKYQVIYADPPWSYSNWKGHKSHINAQYDTLTQEELFELPVADIAEKDSLMFMWATFPNLPQAIELMSKWGFEYKTCGFTWVKKSKKSDAWFWGLGHYTRSNAEICLMGKRGKGVKIINHGVHSVLDDRVMQHSRKPNEARLRIERLVGEDVSRIELFARERAEAWDCWGNEVDKYNI